MTLQGWVWVDALEPRRLFSGGSLDFTFGDAGAVKGEDINLFELSALAVQADGRIVVGSDNVSSDNSDRIDLARLNPDGSVDTTFGDGGRVETKIDETDVAVHQILTTSDGKTLALVKDLVVEYNGDGSVNKHFAGSGVLNPSLAFPVSGLGDGAIQADGKIVLVGTFLKKGEDDGLILMRFNADGSSDKSFGVGGEAAIAFDGFYGSAPHIQRDGKILVAADDANGPRTDTVIAPPHVHLYAFRFDADGRIDRTYGHRGHTELSVKTDPNNSDFANRPQVYDFTLDSHAGGYMIFNGSGDDRMVVKFDSAGQIDRRFGDHGYADVGVFAEADEEGLNTILSAPDGTLLVTSGDESGFDDTVERFTRGGQLDGSFGTNGSAHIAALQIALGNDGTIVSTGGDSGEVDKTMLPGRRPHSRPTAGCASSARPELIRSTSAARPQRFAWPSTVKYATTRSDTFERSASSETTATTPSPSTRA